MTERAQCKGFQWDHKKKTRYIAFDGIQATMKENMRLSLRVPSNLMNVVMW